MKLYRDKARKFVPKAFGIKHYENPTGTKKINDLTVLTLKLQRHACVIFFME